jgi:hypothetical protein
LVPFAVIRRQVIGVVGAVKAVPTELSSSLFEKVWSRLDTWGSSCLDAGARSVGAPEGGTACDVAADHPQAAVVLHHHLVVSEVVHLMALVALTHGARLRACLHGHRVLLILLGLPGAT